QDGPLYGSKHRRRGRSPQASQPRVFPYCNQGRLGSVGSAPRLNAGVCCVSMGITRFCLPKYYSPGELAAQLAADPETFKDVVSITPRPYVTGLKEQALLMIIVRP